MSDVIRNTDRFFHPFDTQPQPIKTRTVKIAINDEDDIKLIQITNQVIKVLNGIKAKRGKLFVVKRYAGKLTKDCVDNFRNLYNNIILREHENEILDKFGENPAYENVVRHMLRTPVLANLICIKFGVLRSGDMKIEEMKEILSYENQDKLYDALSELKRAQKTKSKIVGMDQIIDEENKIIMNMNNELKNRIEEIKNCKDNGICLEDTGNPSNAILGPTSEVPLRQEVFGPLAMQANVKTPSSFQPASSFQSASSSSSSSASSSSSSSQPSSQLPSSSSSQPSSSSSSSSSFQPSSNASIANRKSISSQMSDDKIQEIIDNDDRLNSLFKFIDILNNTNTQTRNKFYDYVRNHQQTGNFRLELQKYLIKDIIKHTFPTDHKSLSSEENQAVVLTTIRMILTSDMKNYPTFLQSFNNNYRNGDICQALKTASNSISTFGFLRFTFSYDKIINNIYDSCTSFSDIISIHLNKLYDMFKTQKPDYIKYMRLKAFKPHVQMTAPTIFYKEDDEDPNNTNFIFTR